MLQTISWKDYFITIGLGTVLYYGWWLIRYYPGWQIRQPDPPEGKTAERDAVTEKAGPIEKTVTGAVGTNKLQEQQPAGLTQAPQQLRAGQERTLLSPQPAEPSQPPQPAEPPQPELPFPAGTERPVFLPAIAANCKNDLLRLLEKAWMANATEEECLDLLRYLLTADPYSKLKGTIFQENIDVLIVRELNRHGSILPDPEMIQKLWTTEG
jgi:hypothetical protein